MEKMSKQLKNILKEYHLYDDNEHGMYKIPVAFLKDNMKVETWKHNRPVSMERVKEIRETYKKNNHVFGTICLAYRKDTFICYDGNHRLFALSSKYISHVLIDIIWDVSHDEIEVAYSIINKGISVPELYGKKNKNIVEVRGTISAWMDDICQKYSVHVKTSPTPYRPNFNRTKVTEQIITFYQENKKKYSIEDILKSIITLNDMYKKGELLGKRKIPAKCIQSGLFLFCASSTINEDHLKVVLRLSKKNK